MSLFYYYLEYKYDPLMKKWLKIKYSQLIRIALCLAPLISKELLENLRCLGTYVSKIDYDKS